MQTILQILERAGGYRPTLSLKIEKLPCQTTLQMPTGYLNPRQNEGRCRGQLLIEGQWRDSTDGATMPVSTRQPK
jgi:hypothetical protein